jgi:hypothetical protein
MKIEYVTDSIEIHYCSLVIKDIYTMMRKAISSVYRENKEFQLKIYFTGNECYVKIEIQSGVSPLTTLIRGHCRTYIAKELKYKYNVITHFSNGIEINKTCITTLSCYDFSTESGYNGIELLRVINI